MVHANLLILHHGLHGGEKGGVSLPKITWIPQVETRSMQLLGWPLTPGYYYFSLLS